MANLGTLTTVNAGKLVSPPIKVSGWLSGKAPPISAKLQYGYRYVASWAVDPTTKANGIDIPVNGTVYGTVKEGGTPIQYGTVLIYYRDTGALIARTKTDASGNFTFVGLDTAGSAYTFSRNWSDLSVSSQSLYGAASPSHSASTGSLVISTGASSDVKSRMDIMPPMADFDLTFEMVIPTSGSAYSGVVYRTTYWGNGNNTYAYVVAFSSSSIEFGRGTNSASESYTGIISVGHGATAGTTATVRILVVGSSHKVYVNGVLKVDVTDSYFPYAGQMAFRLYSISGTQTATYDNMSIIGPNLGKYFVVALDPEGGTTYNAQIYDRIAAS